MSWHIRKSPHLFPLIIIVLTLLLSVACEQKKEPIRIGYVGGLTGRVAGLGIAGRDGVLLAAEEVNRVGGINGHKIVVSVKDDRQDGATARKVVKELLAENVVAIVGHMTSSMTATTLPIVNDAKRVLISPTSKSHYFSGIDDYLFRVTTSMSYNAQKIAAMAFNDMGLRKFAVIYDSNNRAFTESWLEQFRQPFESLGGKIVIAKEFKSGSPDLSFFELSKNIVKHKPDAFLVLASALDCALITQQFQKLEYRVPIFTSEWSFTSDLLNYGGRAVEGLISYHSFNAESQREQYLAYKKRFVTRFGYDPSFASVLSYDAAKLLFKAIERNPDPGQIKRSLLGMGTFPGLQSDFKLDQYGDVNRRLFQTIVVNGQFKVIN
jgi:branched-chain amino acid transport system substrate-binding protein